MVLRQVEKEALTFLIQLYTTLFSHCYVSLSMARDEASPEPAQWKTKQLEVNKFGFLTENIFFTKIVFLRIITNKNRQPLVKENWAAVFKLRLLYYWLYLFHNQVTSFKATKTNKGLAVLMEYFGSFWFDIFTGLLLLCKRESEYFSWKDPQGSSSSTAWKCNFIGTINWETSYKLQTIIWGLI